MAAVILLNFASNVETFAEAGGSLDQGYRICRRDISMLGLWAEKSYQCVH